MVDMGQRKVLRAGTFIDGLGGEPKKNVALIIQGDKIDSIGPWRDGLSGSAPVYDFSDKAVLPGLVDAHCHLTLQGSGLLYDQEVLFSNEFMAVNAIHKMGVMLRSGVTTLRDNGARGSILFGVRDALDHGLVDGPRLLLAGRPLTPTGGHFHFCGGVADSEVEIRREVRRLVQEGADHIKIMASGGGTAGTNPGLPSYNAAELRSAVDSAHDYGRLTTAHCIATKAIANAIEAGLDCIEHAEFNEAVNLARQRVYRPGGS